MKKRPTTIATALTAAAAAASPAKAAITEADALEHDVAHEVNEARVEHGRARVRISWALSRAADAKSRSMGVHGYFGHDAPDGQPFWRQIVRYYTVSGFRRWKVGQNCCGRCRRSPRARSSSAGSRARRTARCCSSPSSARGACWRFA